MIWMQSIADVSAIATAVIAICVSGYVWRDACNKRVKLENYLQEAKSTSTPQRTILHLMAKVGLTEAEVLQASFRSSHVKRVLAEDKETGHASAMLMEYKA